MALGTGASVVPVQVSLASRTKSPASVLRTARPLTVSGSTPSSRRVTWQGPLAPSSAVPKSARPGSASSGPASLPMTANRSVRPTGPFGPETATSSAGVLCPVGT